MIYIYKSFLCLLLIILLNTSPAHASDSAGPHEYTNRLINSASPYLRQHGHNPVDWYPWGEEALAKAKAENKPILVSVGYSTCYWCHVMEREVFSKPDIAETMNKNFINIKVDREERPDVDDIYMTATHLIHGRGGWPNNVFITPDQMPFYAGTTFTYSRWQALQKELSTQWKNNQQSTIRNANATGLRIQQYMKKQGQIPKAAIDKTAFTLFRSLKRTFDARNGGFGSGVKFPREMALLFLLDFHRINNSSAALEMANLTYDRMAMGGIHDHIGGGFHRYSTDREWKVPHFEKMLYNQALLAKGYTELFKLSNYPHHRKIVEDILFYVDRRMTSSDGAFYSALDAETDAVEGAYYAWTKQQLKDALSADDFRLLNQLYSTAEIPKFRGHKHTSGGALNQGKPFLEASFQLGITYQKLLNKVDAIYEKLRKTRDKRKLPRLDDKIIASWNGIMIDALARAGMALDKPDYTARAKRAAEFLLTNMRDENGNLKRIYSRNNAYQNGYFEDYAYVTQGLASLYKATDDPRYLDDIKQLVNKADTLFWDRKSGGYYFTDGTENLIVRLKGADDSAIPSGNAVMAHALLDLYETTGEKKWHAKALSIIEAFSGSIHNNPVGHGHLVHAFMRAEELKKLPPKTEQAKTSAPNNIKTFINQSVESKDVVTLSAKLKSVKGNIATIAVSLKMYTPQWHINANPASLEFLIPTTVDVQTDTTSHVEINYPEAENLTTPLGTVQVYANATIHAVVTFSNSPAQESELRILAQFQACNNKGVCLQPSDVVIALDK